MQRDQREEPVISGERTVSDAVPALRSPVREWIAAFNAHDIPALVALYTDEAELGDSGMKYPRRGKAAIEDWFTQRFARMPTIEYIPTHHYFMAEHQAAVTWTARGRTPRLLGQKWLSRSFHADGVSVFTLENGRIAWQHGYYDHLAVVERVLPFLQWLPSRM